MKTFQVIAINDDEEKETRWRDEHYQSKLNKLSLYEEPSNDVIYHNNLKGLIARIMEGYDASLAIFTKQNRYLYKKDDLVAKCFEGLFGALAQTSNFSVQVELYSIYSDTCYDPLTKMSMNSDSVKIRQNEKGLFLAGTTMKSVSNYAELCTLFEIASRNIALSMIVDKVVTALLKNQTGLTKQHVPYRDCSLTWLMSKCLGGNSYAVALFDNLSEDTAIEFSGIENKPTLSIPTLSHATPFQQ